MYDWNSAGGLFMDMEYAFYQSGFMQALHLFLLGAVVTPAAMGRNDLYISVAGRLASYLVSFGPISLLVFTLYKVSHLN
jgi:hypothetical protein